MCVFLWANFSLTLTYASLAPSNTKCVRVWVWVWVCLRHEKLDILMAIMDGQVQQLTPKSSAGHHITLVTMGGDLQPGCLADRLLTGC